MIIVGIIIIFICAIGWELASLSVFDGVVNKRAAQKFMNINEQNLAFNPYNNTMLLTSPYIATANMITCKYYIEGWGAVPRWTKLSKQIDRYYKIALEKELTNLKIKS